MAAPKGNTYAKGNEGGRPTKYKREYARIAKKLTTLGATDADIAEALGVADSTIRLWRSEYKEFSAALKMGKDEADDRVEQSLYKRAIGFTHDSVKIMQYEGVVQKVEFKEYFAPDPTSMIFWLKNRRKDKWRDKTEVGVDDNLAELLEYARKRREERQRSPRR